MKLLPILEPRTVPLSQHYRHGNQKVLGIRPRDGRQDNEKEQGEAVREAHEAIIALQEQLETQC